MKRIKAILNDHGIRWEMKDGKLLVVNTYLKDGEVFEHWMVCPENEKALLHWLGY